MRSIILAASMLAAAGFNAQAMPAGAATGAQPQEHIELAAEGCGAGFFRAPNGACRPMVRGGPVVVERRAVVRRRCGERVGPVVIRTNCY